MSDLTGAGMPAPAEVPVCPRHPDRPSYVRCQRCGRPTCPECQRTAAVGVHCVDCVRAAARTAPQARTVFGAPVRGGAAAVTYTVIGLNVVSYLLQMAVGRPWVNALAMWPVGVAAEPWTALTTTFLHGGVLHLLFNMYALLVLGQVLEQTLGRWRLATLYLVSALGGSAAFVLLADPTTDGWFAVPMGASGAVFGLFGAIVLVMRRLGRSASGIIVVIGINGVLGFVLPNVAWEAHLGGFVVGLVLGLAYAYAPKALRQVVAVAVPAGLVLTLVALTVVKLLAAA